MTYDYSDPHDLKALSSRYRFEDKKSAAGAGKAVAENSTLRKAVKIGVPAVLGAAALAAGVHHLTKRKEAASMNTATGAMSPAAKLSTTQAVGAPKTTGFAGPSIADIAKPKGFGTPMPGAQKNQI